MVVQRRLQLPSAHCLLDEALAALPCNDHICLNCYKRVHRLPFALWWWFLLERPLFSRVVRFAAQPDSAEWTVCWLMSAQYKRWQVQEAYRRRVCRGGRERRWRVRRSTICG